MKLTRRELLGAVGLGVIGTGSVTVGHGSPGFTNYAYAATPDLDDRRVRVAWYERYNGRFQESQAGPTDPGFDAAIDPATAPASVTEASDVIAERGPVVTVGDVVPGDEGTLVVGLEVADDEDFVPESVDVWLKAAITADEENGLNGPESRAGDGTATGGELDDDLTVELWRDGSPLGTCNGVKELDESFADPIVPRRPVSVAFGPASPITADAGLRVLGGLSPGNTRCIALAWTFPHGATNRSQGDSLAFTLAFGAAPAGERSPFLPAPEER